MELKDFFAQYPLVGVAFSGGVDSAFLLYAAKKYAASFRAYYVKTTFQPQFELDDARRLAENLGIELTVIPVADLLDDDNIASNPKNRCYFCKQKIFTAIKQRAEADGVKIIIDGTNASDDADDRPGMRALEELQVLSPLRLCGLTKADVRKLSKEAGLFTWNKPSYACLATRVPTGQRITYELLNRTEWAENSLSAMGFSDFRVRLAGDSAKLEIAENQLALYNEKHEEIRKILSAEYESVLPEVKIRKNQE